MDVNPLLRFLADLPVSSGSRVFHSERIGIDHEILDAALWWTALLVVAAFLWTLLFILSSCAACKTSVRRREPRRRQKSTATVIFLLCVAGAICLTEIVMANETPLSIERVADRVDSVRDYFDNIFSTAANFQKEVPRLQNDSAVLHLALRNDSAPPNLVFAAVSLPLYIETANQSLSQIAAIKSVGIPSPSIPYLPTVRNIYISAIISTVSVLACTLACLARKERRFHSRAHVFCYADWVAFLTFLVAIIGAVHFCLGKAVGEFCEQADPTLIYNNTQINYYFQCGLNSTNVSNPFATPADAVSMSVRLIDSTLADIGDWAQNHSDTKSFLALSHLVEDWKPASLIAGKVTDAVPCATPYAMIQDTLHSVCGSLGDKVAISIWLCLALFVLGSCISLSLLIGWRRFVQPRVFYATDPEGVPLLPQPESAIQRQPASRQVAPHKVHWYLTPPEEREPDEDEDRLTCKVCFDNSVNTRLNCNHAICDVCAETLREGGQNCPFCRQPIVEAQPFLLP